METLRLKTFAIACTLGLSVFHVSAHAAVDTHSRNLAASCAGCHGTNGHSAGGAPVLAGIDKKLFVSQMKDFKSGARVGTVMHHHAKGYSDEEFEKMADFFAAQKR